MLAILSITAPVYLLIALGYACVSRGLFARTDMRLFGKFVLNLALPALIFMSLAQRSLGEIVNPVFIAAYAGGSLATMGLGLLWARRVGGKPLSAAAVMVMGMACSNSGFVGLPLVTQVFGSSIAGLNLALAVIVENIILIPVALALADGDLGEAAAGASRASRWRAAIWQSLRGLSRNPLVWSVVAGLAFSLTGLPLPSPLARAIGLLATACSALALFVIGGTLVGFGLRGAWRDVSAIAVGKLVVHPLAVMLLVMLLPAMPRELQMALVMTSAVPMMSIYPLLAQKYGQDGMAASALLGATIASFFTLTALLWVLRPPV